MDIQLHTSEIHNIDRRAMKTIALTIAKRVKTLKQETYLDTMFRLFISNDMKYT